MDSSFILKRVQVLLEKVLTFILDIRIILFIIIKFFFLKIPLVPVQCTYRSVIIVLLR